MPPTACRSRCISSNVSRTLLSFQSKCRTPLRWILGERTYVDSVTSWCLFCRRPMLGMFPPRIQLLAPYDFSLGSSRIHHLHAHLEQGLCSRSLPLLLLVFATGMREFGLHTSTRILKQNIIHRCVALPHRPGGLPFPYCKRVSQSVGQRQQTARLFVRKLDLFQSIAVAADQANT